MLTFSEQHYCYSKQSTYKFIMLQVHFSRNRHMTSVAKPPRKCLLRVWIMENQV